MTTPHTLIKGTLILTLTGFLTRFLGFLYRIFLSQTVGAKGMGIYQLIFPVQTLCFAMSAGGMQTAISRFVASKTALKDSKGARDLFLISTLFSVALASCIAILLYRHASWLAIHILFEESCTPLLQILAYSIPLGTFHACTNGYYIAKKRLAIPALIQLAEQLARMLGSYLVLCIWKESATAITPALAVIGLVTGELFAMTFSALFLTCDLKKITAPHTPFFPLLKEFGNLFHFALPLTCNRILINLLNSMEAVWIPAHLCLYGLDHSSSLSAYGILTGMALPLILFPCSVINAVSTVLLPSVAENQITGNHIENKRIFLVSVHFSLFLGFLSLGFFFFFGDFLGIFLFKNEFAGSYIKTLAFICPFLYLSNTLTGILNGLGHANRTLFLNLLGLLVRLCSIFFLIPQYGIKGYLWGLIFSELFTSLLSFFYLSAME